MPDSGMPPCVAEITEAAKGKLSDDEILELAERIQGERRRLIASGAVDQIDQKLMQFAKDEGERAKLAAMLQQKHAALSVIKRDRVNTLLSSHMKAGLSPKKAMLAVFEGSSRDLQSGRVSAAAMSLAYEGKFVGELVAQLDRDLPGWYKMANDPHFSADVVREMHELREGGSPGISKNKDAQVAAKALAGAAESSRQRLNSLGGFIGKLDGWAGPQIHDSNKMVRVTASDWAKAILPKLDRERTFPGLSDAEALRALEDVHTTITTGRGNEITAARKGERVGPANLAKSLAKERVLHFKDADSWLAYHQEFGRGNVFTAILEHQRRSARMAAQMDMFGPNPEMMVRSLVDEMQTNIRNDAKLTPKQRAKQMAALDIGKGLNTGIGAAMAEMQGLTLGHPPSLMAEIGSGVRAVQSMAKLGGAVISSLSDMVTVAANLKYQGRSIFATYPDQFAQFLRGRGDAEQREIAFLLGEGFDGLVDHIHSSVYAADSAPGKMSGAMSRMFKYSGLTGWTDSLRAINARMMSSWMGSKVGQGWEALDRSYQRVLSQHGINQQEWEALRQAVFKSDEGKTYVTPDVIRDLPDSAIAPLAKGTSAKALDRARYDLEISLRQFFADEQNFGVIETDAASRRLTVAGTQAGTLPGEVLRFMTQFKGFPIAFTQRVIGRSVYGFSRDVSKFDQIGHIGHLIAGLLVAGIMSQTAKDFLRGYAPRDYTTKEGILGALAQSGGAGIYGDFLFGQASRMGNTAGETMLGPAGASISGLLNYWMKARDGDATAGEGLNLALQNVPFMNLWYARPVLDFLVLNSLKESLSPGFLRRQDQSRMKDYGQMRLLPARATEAFK
jgi:hypothetical protein